MAGAATPERFPRLGLTLGDPAGVGPELCLQALASAEMRAHGQLIVFGDAAVLHAAAAATGQAFDVPVVARANWQAAAATRFPEPMVVDFAALAEASFTPGRVSAATGRAAYGYFTAAIQAAQTGAVDAIVTLPINKEALALAEVPFPGHTEILAAQTEATRTCMMQYSTELTCTFVTTHVGYAEVPGLLSAARIGDVIDLTAEALTRLRARRPRLLVCGLNPHAGEHGLFGDDEEERIIAPAVAAARARGHDVTGPVPPDTAFLPSRRAAFDAVVCMYHDQGHIPLKALAFDSAVNTTLGLPLIRTSVDHGTALDIAWQNPSRARPGSLFAAIQLAAHLAKGSTNASPGLSAAVGSFE